MMPKAKRGISDTFYPSEPPKKRNKRTSLQSTGDDAETQTTSSASQSSKADSLWDIKDIINEDGTRYQVDWADNKRTGQSYPPSWYVWNGHALVKPSCSFHIVAVYVKGSFFCSSKHYQKCSRRAPMASMHSLNRCELHGSWQRNTKTGDRGVHRHLRILCDHIQRVMLLAHYCVDNAGEVKGGIQ